MPGSGVAPAYTNISISTKEPWVVPDVAGKKINFLVDTGATHSVLNFYTGPLSSNSNNIMGVEEKYRACWYMPPVPCQFESQMFP